MGYFDDPLDTLAHDIIPRAKKWVRLRRLYTVARENNGTRLVDWSYIHRCADVAVANDLPLIGNGDAHRDEDYNAFRWPYSSTHDRKRRDNKTLPHD